LTRLNRRHRAVTGFGLRDRALNGTDTDWNWILMVATCVAKTVDRLSLSRGIRRLDSENVWFWS